MSWRGAAVAVIALGAAAPIAAQSRQALLAAEDARDASPAGLAPLLAGLGASDPAVAAQAIRALGRFERLDLLHRVIPFLADSRVPVRIAAAHAVGLLGKGGTEPGAQASPAAASVLVRALAAEPDPAVLGALARALGRLPPSGLDARAQSTLLTLATRAGPPSLLVDVARALEAFTRAGGRHTAGDPALETRLRALATFPGAMDPAAAAIRRAGLLALIHLRQVDVPTLRAALVDSEIEVRRLAVVALADTGVRPERRELLEAALIDPYPMVRFEAVRAWGRHFQVEDCRPILRSVSDPAPSVALRAIDQLASPCGPSGAPAMVLRRLADSLVAPERWRFQTIANWHRGAHALVSLATIEPNQVRGILVRAAENRTWQVRMYAARAAGIVGDVDRLLVLASDGNDNVREAAVQGLHRIQPGAAARVFVSELDRDDHQLLITTAKALEGTLDRSPALAGLLRALGRLTGYGADNSRDARLALLDRLEELGGGALADSLTPYLHDYDPAVAARAAAVLGRWTGKAWTAEPRLAPKPRVDVTESDGLAGATLRFTMSPTSGGGHFDLALLPGLAPVTVARVAGLATSGYYDGLTFHRVEPNFVIQGGGPKANEYTGDAPFLRDEVGPISHERGTVGISTRGRDTGDAQIFVNLVENLRLDFDYTVFARVVDGMDVIDSILEGDVIERVDLIRR
jgi:cyclophilin family peptidyl-prolyl cis-trans isomerase/HEAT repeat protein